MGRRLFVSFILLTLVLLACLGALGDLVRGRRPALLARGSALAA